MAVNRTIRVEVFGVAEALKELKELEKTTYNRLIRDLKRSALPLARAVAAEFPEEPLMNWHSTGDRVGKARLPAYNIAAVRAGVKPATSQTLRRGADMVGILRLDQKDAGGQVYDSAGSQNPGTHFVQNLDKRLTTKSRQGRYRSRVMYPALQKHLPLLVPAIEESIQNTCKVIEEKINGTGSAG